MFKKIEMIEKKYEKMQIEIKEILKNKLMNIFIESLFEYKFPIDGRNPSY